VPASWCSFFSDEEYVRFADLLRSELQRRGPVAIDLEEGYADLTLAGWSTRVGLAGPAQKCHARPQSEWRRTLAEHFSVLEGLREKSSFMDDFESVRPYLKVRLYPDPYGDYPEQSVSRLLAPKIGVYPVADMPDEILVVLRSNLNAWPLDEDSVFELGFQRVRATEKLPPEVVNISPVISFHTLRGNSFFVNANALWLEDYIDVASPYGALVAVPNRHEVLFHRIRSWELLEQTHRALIAIVRKLWEDGPGSISPEIYWWRRREWTHIPTTVGEGFHLVELPDAFTSEVVEPLRGSG
jgi:hypothetical protein